MEQTKVGIIGTNWGRVHIGAFKNAKCTIDALIGKDLEKTQFVAFQESVPVAATELETLNALDVSVIATPIETHQSLLPRVSTPAIYCEKPLGISKDFYSDFSTEQLIGVNYAFGYLKTAQCAKAAIESLSLGQVNEISIEQSAHSDKDISIQQLFKEVCVHPLSWIFQVFGPINYLSHALNDNTMSVDLALADSDLKVHFKRQKKAGIKLSVKIKGDKNTMVFKGGYSPAKQWFFDPILIGRDPINKGEYSRENDIWYQANCIAVKTFVDLYNDRIDLETAKSLGYFSLDDAFKFEKFINHLS